MTDTQVRDLPRGFHRTGQRRRPHTLVTSAAGLDHNGYYQDRLWLDDGEWLREHRRPCAFWISPASGLHTGRRPRRAKGTAPTASAPPPCPALTARPEGRKTLQTFWLGVAGVSAGFCAFAGIAPAFGGAASQPFEAA